MDNVTQSELWIKWRLSIQTIGLHIQKLQSTKGLGERCKALPAGSGALLWHQRSGNDEFWVTFVCRRSDISRVVMMKNHISYIPKNMTAVLANAWDFNCIAYVRAYLKCVSLTSDAWESWQVGLRLDGYGKIMENSPTFGKQKYNLVGWFVIDFTN